MLNIANISLLIPIIDIIFNDSGTQELEKIPALYFDIASIKDNIYYYLSLLVHKEGKWNALMLISSGIFLLIFLSSGLRYISALILGRIKSFAVGDMRRQLFAKLIYFPISFFHHHKKGDILSRIMSDLSIIEHNFFQLLDTPIRAPIHFLGYLTFMFILSPKLTLIIIIGAPIILYIINIILKYLRKQVEELQRSLANIGSIAEEVIICDAHHKILYGRRTDEEKTCQRAQKLSQNTIIGF